MPKDRQRLFRLRGRVTPPSSRSRRIPSFLLDILLQTRSINPRRMATKSVCRTLPTLSLCLKPFFSFRNGAGSACSPSSEEVALVRSGIY